MRQATKPPWSGSIVIREVDELDWDVEPSVDQAEPIPLVRRRAAPRPRTLAGVGGPSPTAERDVDVIDLIW